MTSYDGRLDIAVGDTVLVTPGDRYRRREPWEATVVRIGRTYAYVTEYSREVAYELVGGRGRHGDRSGRIFTREGYAEYRRRSAALGRVNDLTRGYSWANGLSVEQLEAIAAILEGPEAT